MNNLLCLGDSEKIMSHFQKDSIDLIYMDPPFFTRRFHETLSYDGERVSFDDVWKNGIEEYLIFMRSIFEQSLKLLKKTGSFFIHCDWHAVHYLKIEMDKIFGYHNFRNEIIWKRHNSQNNNKQGAKIFGRMHDTILVYSKSKHYKWYPPFQNYSDEYIKRTYKWIDDKTKERYALSDLSGPGGSSKGNPYFEFLGFKRYWRYNEKTMVQLFNEGKIIQTQPGTLPKLKRFLKDMNGIPVNDLWFDIKSEQSTKRKSVFYPTQKPISLLKRIVDCSTKAGDLILDPFCGSGTSLICAGTTNRKWIGIDNNPTAIKVSKLRLKGAGLQNFDYVNNKKLTIIR